MGTSSIPYLFCQNQNLRGSWIQHISFCFWQNTEALLYGFQSIAETIDVNYSDVVPGLIGLIPHISISNVQLADTVMFTIGEEIEQVEGRC